MKNLSGIRNDVRAYLHSARTRKQTIEPMILKSIALFYLIKSEVEPIIQNEREAFERLSGKRQTEFNQGFVFDLGKYQDFKTLRLGKVEKEIDSESNDAMFVCGMDKAESDSRNVAM